LRRRRKILYVLCYRAPDYVRTETLLEELEGRPDLEVIRCINRFRGVLRYPEILLRLPLLLLRHRPDLVIVGFRGIEIFPFVAPLCRRTVFDAFLSVHEALVEERGLLRPGRLPERLVHRWERHSARRADLVLMDTAVHADFMADRLGLPREKFTHLYVGAPLRRFAPGPPPDDRPRSGTSVIDVFFYGTFLPVHGIDVIVRAAARLSDRRDIRFTLVGRGPERARIEELIGRAEAANIDLLDWIPWDELPRRIARADVCLGGHYSLTGKADRVIAGKVFQFLAAGRPVIAGRSAAVDELFADRRELLMVPRGDPSALAAAVQELADDVALRRRLAEAGRVFMTDSFARIQQAAVDRILGAVFDGKGGGAA